VPVVTAHGEIEAELIVGQLRDAGLDARVVRDGKQSPGAWMYVGHDPFEAMTVVVPDDEIESAREVLEQEDDRRTPDAEGGTESGVLQTLHGSLSLFRWAVVVVALVLVVALLEAQLTDVLPFLGEP
jgi:hypothetical protein